MNPEDFDPDKPDAPGALDHNPPQFEVGYAQNVKVGKALKKIARMIDRELHKAAGTRVPFSLYTWGGNRAQYVSNAARPQVKEAMKETLDRWGEDDGPFTGAGHQ